MSFSLQDLLRAAFFDKVGERSMYYSVYKMSLMKWQLRWTCSLPTDLGMMIRKGSVPWIRGVGVVTFSTLWSPAR